VGPWSVEARSHKGCMDGDPERVKQEGACQSVHAVTRAPHVHHPPCPPAAPATAGQPAQ